MTATPVVERCSVATWHIGELCRLLQDGMENRIQLSTMVIVQAQHSQRLLREVHTVEDHERAEIDMCEQYERKLVYLRINYLLQNSLAELEQSETMRRALMIVEEEEVRQHLLACSARCHIGDVTETLASHAGIGKRSGEGHTKRDVVPLSELLAQAQQDAAQAAANATIQATSLLKPMNVSPAYLLRQRRVVRISPIFTAPFFGPELSTSTSTPVTLPTSTSTPPASPIPSNAHTTMVRSSTDSPAKSAVSDSLELSCDDIHTPPHSPTNTVRKKWKRLAASGHTPFSPSHNAKKLEDFYNDGQADIDKLWAEVEKLQRETFTAVEDYQLLTQYCEQLREEAAAQREIILKRDYWNSDRKALELEVKDLHSDLEEMKGLYTSRSLQYDQIHDMNNELKASVVRLQHQLKETIQLSQSHMNDKLEAQKELQRVTHTMKQNQSHIHRLEKEKRLLHRDLVEEKRRADSASSITSVTSEASLEDPMTSMMQFQHEITEEQLQSAGTRLDTTEGWFSGLWDIYSSFNSETLEKEKLFIQDDGGEQENSPISPASPLGISTTSSTEGVNVWEQRLRTCLTEVYEFDSTMMDIIHDQFKLANNIYNSTTMAIPSAAAEANSLLMSSMAHDTSLTHSASITNDDLASETPSVRQIDNYIYHKEGEDVFVDVMETSEHAHTKWKEKFAEYDVLSFQVGVDEIFTEICDMYYVAGRAHHCASIFSAMLSRLKELEQVKGTAQSDNDSVQNLLERVKQERWVMMARVDVRAIKAAKDLLTASTAWPKQPGSTNGDMQVYYMPQKGTSIHQFRLQGHIKNSCFCCLLACLCELDQIHNWIPWVKGNIIQELSVYRKLWEVQVALQSGFVGKRGGFMYTMITDLLCSGIVNITFRDASDAEKNRFKDNMKFKDLSKMAFQMGGMQITVLDEETFLFELVVSVDPKSSFITKSGISWIVQQFQTVMFPQLQELSAKLSTNWKLAQSNKRPSKDPYLVAVSSQELYTTLQSRVDEYLRKSKAK